MITPPKSKVKSLLAMIGILPFLRSIKEKVDAKRLDKRLFWDGERLCAPVANVPLFKNLKRETFTITHNKESRDCIVLDSGESVTLSVEVRGKSRIVMSFAYEGKPNLSEGIEVWGNGIKQADLKYIVPNKWHNIAFDSKKGEMELVIKNTSSSPMEVAHPIVDQEYAEDITKSKTPKNIIVLLLDALNRDSVGPYNHEAQKYTPNISRFFDKSFKYTSCFTQSEWTFPALHSLFLSRYSVDHGLSDTRADFDIVPLDNKDTLAVHMRNLGYSTFAYSTVKVFHPAFNLHIGFDRFFYDLFPQSIQTHREVCFKAVTQLQRNKMGKNFMFLHFFDTHEPWGNVEEIEESMLDNSRITDPEVEYKYHKKGQGDTKGEPIFDDASTDVFMKRRNARLLNTDLSIQVLLDYLEKSGEAKDTVVVLCSDHGCKFLGWEQPLLCDTRVGVPLLIRYPTIEGGIQNELVESSMDLGPTILKIAGYEGKWGHGKILPPFGKERHECVVSESIFGNLCKVAVRDENYVYHCVFPYDKRKRRIKLDKIRDRLLFERKNESMCVDISKKVPKILERMHDFVINHLSRYPHKLG